MEISGAAERHRMLRHSPGTTIASARPIRCSALVCSLPPSLAGGKYGVSLGSAMSNPAATTANLNGGCDVLNASGRVATGASSNADRIEASPAPWLNPQTPSYGPPSSR